MIKVKKILRCLMLGTVFAALIACSNNPEDDGLYAGGSSNSVAINKIFWGDWTRLDNGQVIHIGEKAIMYEEKAVGLSNGTSGKIETSIGTFVKTSDNVLKLNNVPLFRSCGKDVEYCFTLVGFNAGSIFATNLGEGYTVKASCDEYPSYKETVVSDANGKVTLHSPVANVENTVVITAGDGSKITATLKPKYNGENLGSITVVNSSDYALKVTGEIPDNDYLYYGNLYTLDLNIENISNKIASNSRVELSCDDPRLYIDEKAFNIASIANGMVKSVPVMIRYNAAFKTPYINTTIKVKFTDAKTEKSWIDSVPLRFHAFQSINIKADSTENNREACLNGFIMYPDFSGKFFSVPYNEEKGLWTHSFTVPKFDADYKIIFGGAVIGETLSQSTEMKYSLAVGKTADEVRGVFSIADMNFAEYGYGNNDEENAYPLDINESIKAYLSINDMDFYSLKVYEPKIAYTVNHLLQQENGEYVSAEDGKETKYGFVFANTEAEAKVYEGYIAQEVTQKEIDNYEDTVIDIFYDAFLTGIEVSAKPVKTSYYLGEEFNSAGLVVKAHYGWGEKAITEYTCNAEVVLSTPGLNKPVTVTFEGKTATFNIDVNADLVFSSLEYDAWAEIDDAKVSGITGIKFDYNSKATEGLLQLMVNEAEPDVINGTSFTVTGDAVVEGNYIKLSPDKENAQFTVTFTDASVISRIITSGLAVTGYGDGVILIKHQIVK